MLLVFAVLAGCGDEPSPLTTSQFFQKRAEITCTALESACLLPVAACTAGRVAEYTAEQQNALAYFRSFIPKNAEACLAKVEEVFGKIKQGTVALPAADYNAMQAICANVYRGSSIANGPCQIDADCYGDLICDKGYCGTAKVVAPGAGCANIGEICPQGTYCSNATGVWFCSEKAGLQVSCATTPCLETLRCAGGVCVARLGMVEACTGNDDCTTGFCEPYALKCAEDIRFANGTAACLAMGGS
jgi:hypothetical protein